MERFTPRVTGAAFALALVASLAIIGCTPTVHMRTPTTLNLMEVGKAAIAYTSHHDNRLPPAHSWPQALATEENLPESALLDPANPSGGRMFAMNAKLSNLPWGDVRRAPETVFFFECAPGSPAAGGPELLPAQPRSAQGYAISYVDGHVEFVTREAIGRLIWDPRLAAPPAKAP